MQFHKILQNAAWFCMPPDVVGSGHDKDNVGPVHDLIQTPTKALSKLPSHIFNGEFVGICYHLLDGVPAVATNSDLTGAEHRAELLC